MHRTIHRRGFTLIEMLVASTLAMLVLSLAMGSYRHSQRMITRSEALLRLHRVAGDIAERWEKDCTALMQHVACNTTTVHSGGTRSLVQFTGMRTIPATFDNRIYDYPHDTDMAWTRWEWRAADRRLTWAQSPPPHWVTAYSKEFFSHLEQDGLPIKPVIAMRPNPVRTYAEFTSGMKRWYDPFATDPSVAQTTRIFDHLFLTGTDVDGVTRTYSTIAQEMTANAVNRVPNSLLAASPAYLNAATWATVPVPDPRRTLAEDVTDCSIAIITRGGTVIGGGGAINHSIDGADQAGLGSGGQRPDVMRLSLTLTDRRSGLVQSFTFAAKAPR